MAFCWFVSSAVGVFSESYTKMLQCLLSNVRGIVYYFLKKCQVSFSSWSFCCTVYNKYVPLL